MPNRSGNAYGLTTLCPIKNGSVNDQSFSSLTRKLVQHLPLNEASPFAKVPNTYLARLYILNDVFYEEAPAREEHLKSKYLVFTSNFYGELEPYLRGMWQHAREYIQAVWCHCVGFNRAGDENDFVEYIKKCQVETTFYFNGSTDDPLQEQLKSLYLKQEFSDFVLENQAKSAEELLLSFNEFIARTVPKDVTVPSWEPGKSEV